MAAVPFEAFFAHQAAFLSCAEKRAWFSRLTAGDDDSWTLERLSQLTGRRLRSTRWNPDAARAQAKEEYERCLRGDFSAVVYGEPDYPARLAAIYDPPFLLYLKGNPKRLYEKGVSVVGTRIPEGRASAAAFDFGFELGKGGIPVVSGLALGIDSFAHAGNHRSGVGSVAVLGSGLDFLYPVSNRSLASELLRLGGLLVSEFSPTTPPAPFRFPQRNRIVSGLTPLTLVVQAPKKSGALITADFALEQGREVAVAGVGLRGERGSGTKALADSGAFIIDTKEDLWMKVTHS